MSIVAQLQKRKWLTVGTLVIVVGGGYWWYRSHTTPTVAPQYVTAPIERGALVVSVSGSGQVATSNQVDVKPEVSGTVRGVNIKNGQEVKQGDVLVQLSTVDAYKTVRDAELSLESARLSFEKTSQPADTLSLIQSEHALTEASENKAKAEDDLNKAYDDGFNTVSDAFLDLPDIMSGLNDMLFGNTLSQGQWNMDYYANAAEVYDDKAKQYKTDTMTNYQTARSAYDTNFDDYKHINRSSDRAAIERMINETYDTTKDIAEAIKSANNLVRFYKDKLIEHGVKINPVADTHLNSLNTFTGKTNTQLLSLLAIKRTIASSKDAIASAERSIQEKTESLAKLKAGADPLDVKSQELSVRQREAALADAQSKLASYTIRAPISGIIAKVGAVAGDQVGSGSAVATLIAKQKIAEISLNEVDVAKVKVGQKVTLSFDAVDGLTLTGLVSEIDTLGTVSQGVVSYNIKISFDSGDDRVKPGMSVSANIITDVRDQVLLAPNSAVKTDANGSSYVETLVSGAPVRHMVQVGAVNDTYSEVTGDIAEGDNIITQTITASAATATRTTNGTSILQGLGGVGGRNFNSGGGRATGAAGR